MTKPSENDAPETSGTQRLAALVVLASSAALLCRDEIDRHDATAALARLGDLRGALGQPQAFDHDLEDPQATLASLEASLAHEVLGILPLSDGPAIATSSGSLS